MRDTKYNINFAKYVILYLWITYLIYLVLPYDIDRTGIKEIYTVIFLISVSIPFYFGCYSVKIREGRVIKSDYSGMLIPENTLIILLILAIVFTALFINDMISQGMGMLTLNLGENYVSYQQHDAQYNSLGGQFYVLYSPVRYFLIAYCVIIYKRLTTFTRWLYYIYLVVTFLHSIIQGKNVGLGYIVLMIGVAYYFVCLKNNNFKFFKRYAIIGGLLFIAYFVFATSLRVEAYGGSLDDQLISKDNWVIDIFGLEIGSGLLKLLNYFSHGYKGLNYCLQLPFEWSNGYGGAMGLDSYISQYLHIPSQLRNTYPGRMETVFGYSGTHSWPTVFPWWASDLSFPGVVVFMFFVGRFMCLLFKDAYCKTDIISAVFFSYFFIMIACLPLNNQLMQTRSNFLTTMTFLIIWMIRTNKGRSKRILHQRQLI